MIARIRRGLVLTALCAPLLPAGAQTIDDIRQDLRDSLRQAQFAAGFAGVIATSDELELHGASYWIDDTGDTQLSSLGLPYRHTFHPLPSHGPDSTSRERLATPAPRRAWTTSSGGRCPDWKPRSTATLSPTAA